MRWVTYSTPRCRSRQCTKTHTLLISHSSHAIDIMIVIGDLMYEDDLELCCEKLLVS
jgi:hypothetical protein